MNEQTRLNIQVSRGNAATHLRQGGRFYARFFCSLSLECNSETVIKIGQFAEVSTKSLCAAMGQIPESTESILVDFIINRNFG